MLLFSVLFVCLIDLLLCCFYVLGVLQFSSVLVQCVRCFSVFAVVLFSLFHVFDFVLLFFVHVSVFASVVL